jgi:hypothetical protein
VGSQGFPTLHKPQIPRLQATDREMAGTKLYDVLHLSHNKTTLFNMFTDVVVDDHPGVLEKANRDRGNGNWFVVPLEQGILKWVQAMQ